MKTGLIGLPSSGVTTIFCLFCNRNYTDLAFSGKTEVNLGETRVPDSRVDRLADIFKPRKSVYTTIEFADVPVDVDSGGALAASTVNNIRNMDAVAIVIRSFNNPAIPHTRGSVDPLRDLHSILEEALLADLIQVEKKLEKNSKEGRLKGREGQIFTEIKAGLDAMIPIRDQELSSDIRKEISGFRFLTEKPFLVVINTEPGESIPNELEEYLRSAKLSGLPIAGQFELELTALTPEEQGEFLSEIGVSEGGRDRFINLVYRNLDLISFLTYGDDECRAWSLPRGSDAVEAAGRIHSDLARGFIRAEIVNFDEFIQCGASIAAVKKAGKMRMEGKKYLIRDGDMVTILFNI
ncbi:redox-regulated ATPase YchF [bacterium]|nr:redox-regulated ATPase YchF [candidate division CSSED10-310 bacterium]